jgi:ABC-2 type transport system ATP-binding protein
MTLASVPPSIRLESVSKWYGEVMGLNEVSAEFGPGVSGLLGPNGAGKSTLIKVVCGMLRPSLGRALVNGEPTFDRARVMRRVGLCPEQDAFYPGIPIWSVVTYLTRLHGYSKDEASERARRALERVGLSAVLDRSAAGFSKGMRQRAKLAMLLAHDPDVIVLDEPLNGLDPPGRRELARLIRELGASGRCVLVSSHILHEVESMARRILFLHAGRVLADGTVEEIRREMPEHPLTVRIGTSTPSSLAARVLALDGVRRVERVEGGIEAWSTRPDELFDRLAAWAGEDGLSVQSVVPMDEDLEAVFRYLTR